MQIPKKLATNVLAVASLTAMPVILAGCGASDPSVEEVTNRFQSMVQVKGEPDGETTVEVESAGTIWALVRRDDVITVSPSQCHIDGQPMGDATEDLNIPEPADVGDTGKKQTLFAFASSPVENAGSYTVSCALDAAALLFLVEPRD